MSLFILGVLLVFVKTNLQVLDMGVFFYASNIVGYLLIFWGIRRLEEEVSGLQRLKPFVLLMVAHSIGFAVLNGSGHSIQTIPLSGGVASAVALGLALLAIAGMGMIFYILHEVILLIRVAEETSFSDVGDLEKMPGLLVVLLAIICVLFFAAPFAASVLMLVLWIAELVFLLHFSARARMV